MTRGTALGTFRIAFMLGTLTVAQVQAQDIVPFRAQPLDTPVQQAVLDGVYDLTQLGAGAPPVSTPSSWGTVRGGTLTITGGRYTIVYVVGAGEQLRIEGDVVPARGGASVSFRPATPGIAGSSAAVQGNALVSVIDGAFGIPNARIVFTKRNQGSAPPAPPRRDDPPPPQVPPVAPACPAARGSNKVEPLSNGLALHWTLPQIRERFGAGTPSWDGRTVTYDDFRVAVGGARESIWHLHITGSGTCLNSGLRPGSTRADVQRVFGSAYGATYGQYRLTFEYDGDRLVDIGIDPAAGDFRRQDTPAPAPPKPAPQPPKPPKQGRTPPPPAPASPAILGTWWGVQSMTQIEVKADGTYTSPNGGKGTWKMSGNDIVFTGALQGWNQGRAKLTEGGWIEFLWKDASGAAYLFQLVRR